MDCLTKGAFSLTAPGLLEVKRVFQPVKFEYDPAGRVFITNEYDFINLDAFEGTYNIQAIGDE
jgi:beta-galactosidase